MLERALAIVICGVMLFAGCKRSVDLKLIGRWQAHTADDAGEITFHEDHSFLSWERAVTYSQQPPVLWGGGEWHVTPKSLVLSFHADSHRPAVPRVEFALDVHDRDHITLRQASGLETTLERLK
jgi:hypothetical protein